MGFRPYFSLGTGLIEKNNEIGKEFQICKMKKILQISFPTIWTYLSLLNRTIKNGEDGKFDVIHHNKNV